MIPKELVILLLTLTLVNGQYSCPQTCLPPACVCGTKSIPGGLSVADTPQFVTLTWDDAVQTRMLADLEAISTRFANKNGCPIPFTYFVSMNYTDFHSVQHVANQYGAEVAAHTINHPDLVTIPPSIAALEISGSRDILSVYAGVPKSAITGFRHPFLSFNKATFDAVFASGITYDSSITLNPIVDGYWPHTLDYGMPYNPQNCVNCPLGTTLVYPGKWTIPMYNLLNADGTVWVSMDPSVPPTSFEEALEKIKFSFRKHYETKLPFGIYQHIAQYIAYPQYESGKIKMMTDFIQWATTTFPDVWFVTNQQLIKWIQTPVTSENMANFLPCRLAPTDPSNSEICDGVNNVGTGSILANTVDVGLLETCVFPFGSFSSCFGCPAVQPNYTLVLPTRSGNRVLIPDAGCPDALQSWDPVTGTCVMLKRPIAIISADGAANPADSSQKNGSSSGFNAPNIVLRIMGVFFSVVMMC